MKSHIVWYSGGINSWFSGYLIAQKFGKENTQLVFADTTIEDEDVYRFLYEGAEAIGSELIVLKDGRNPWDIYFKEKFINHRAAKCSYYLKFVPCHNWLTENYPNPDDVKLYIGIDWSEYDRMDKIVKRWKPYSVSSPLCTGNKWYSRQNILEKLGELGIEIPRMYKMGFPHANCSGFCVRAGKSQFKKLLAYFPDKYDYHARKEQEFRDHINNHNVGILREIRQGKTTIRSLVDFRDEIENTDQLDLFDGQGCGCFTDFE